MRFGLLPTRSLPLMLGNGLPAFSHRRWQAFFCIGINSLMPLRAFQSESAERQVWVTG